MGYQPIENYGIIGDLHTVALVGMNGSIDWLCFPNFDSPSIFAAMLDNEKGGRFQIAPTVDGITFKQMYWPETNVLVTRFLSTGGVAEVTDYMPARFQLRARQAQDAHLHRRGLLRVIELASRARHRGASKRQRQRRRECGIHSGRGRERHLPASRSAARIRLWNACGRVPRG
jgi:GH15 family glucan-1,4-alpha-glucosidase